MKIEKVDIREHVLKFKFDAGTSRGVLKEKKVWYLIIESNTGLVGIGEVSPLKGLSTDFLDKIPTELERLKKSLLGIQVASDTGECLHLAQSLTNLQKFPSVVFAIEMALLDLAKGGKRLFFDTDFYAGKERIPINGLIWMGNENFMQKQLSEKLSEGFDCIKMKIGAIDFTKEIDLLSSIRGKFNADQIVLRVDANGAFDASQALDYLTQLAEIDIHSIEQPIKAGQIEKMRLLCASTPLPIALDEELIGIHGLSNKRELLNLIQPQYIILKPTLLGGIKSTLEWIEVARDMNIGWWMTSMLESNIGLNAIAQLASHLKVSIPQGLGTGKLYHNNIESPLTIKDGKIYYEPSKAWEFEEVIY